MMTDSPVPMSGSGGWTRGRIVFLSVSAVLAVAVLVWTSEILLPFALAGITSYVLTPAVEFCERRLHLLCHSMGGHILLRTLHKRPGTFAAAVMSAPMLRANTRGYPRWVARAVCTLQNLCGRGSDWVWGMEGRDPLHMAFEDNMVTSDRIRLARTQAALAALILQEANGH